MRDLTRRLTPVVAALTVAAPFMYLVYAVVRRWVNVPFWDDWELYSIVRQDRAGQLDFMDFYQQHNEHRILWPNMVMFGLASASRWDVRVEMAFSLTVAALTFVLLAAMIRRTIAGAAGAGHESEPRGLRWWYLAATFLASLIFFAPTAVQNWLWGWQIEWYMTVAGIVLAIWALGSWRTAQPWKQLLVAILGATLATFSLGGGMLVWIVCLPIFALSRRLWRWSLLWIAAAVIEIGLYYTDYQSTESQSTVHVITHHPIGLLRYVSVYLSRVLVPTFDQTQAILMTGGLLFLLLFGTGYVWWRHRSQFGTLVPWLCLSLVAIGSAVVTGAARLTYGIGQARSSRYVTISLLLVVATLVVAVKAAQLAWTAPRPPAAADLTADADPPAAPDLSAASGPVATALTVKRRPSAATRLARVLTIAGILTVALAYGHSHRAAMAEMNGYSVVMHNAQDCVRTASSPQDDCLLMLYPDKQQAWERLEYMRSIGWVVPESSKCSSCAAGHRRPPAS